MGLFDRVVDGFMKVLDRQFPRDRIADEEIAARDSTLLALSNDEARAKLDRVLAEGTVFETDEEHSDDTRLDVLAPNARELMRKYREIRLSGFEERLSRDLIPQALAFPGFIWIGVFFENVIVCVRPGDEAIYQWDGTTDAPTEEDIVSPSACHWLLTCFDPADSNR
ncbi:MAG: hypothetical protein ACLQVD_09005 [Capsulimonadaceae bacterium]